MMGIVPQRSMILIWDMFSPFPNPLMDQVPYQPAY